MRLAVGLERGQVEAERRHVGDQVVGRLLEGDEHPGLVVLGDPADEELHGEECLAASGGAADERRASPGQPAAGHLVEPADTGRRLRQRGKRTGDGALVGDETSTRNVRHAGSASSSGGVEPVGTRRTNRRAGPKQASQLVKAQISTVSLPAPGPAGDVGSAGAAARLEESDELVPVGGRRLRRPDEVGDDLGEADWLLGVGEVTGTPDDLETAPGDGLVSGVGVLDRDDPVAVPPDDQGGDMGGEVEPVGGAHRLAARVDDGPDGAHERLPVGRLRQRRVRAPRLRRPLGPQSPVVEEPGHGVAPAPHHGRKEHGHHVLGARQRQAAKDPAHLAAEAAAVDEHQALAQLRVLVGQLHGDPAAERLADHGCPLDLEDGQQVAQTAGVGAEGVVPERLGRFAMPDQVGGDDGEVACQQRHHLGPRRELPAMPWTRSSTGPSPARR